ncbi:MAG: hypothetical protein V1809_03055 [Planctomycetota bacterium]
MNTIRDLAQRVAGGDGLPVALGDFLDAFYRQPAPVLLAEEPEILRGRVKDGEIFDAYLAAIAERLARQSGFDVPSWVFGGARHLHRPVFGTESAVMRATLLLESPPEFRSRNIFVTANVLDRASRHAA